MLHRTTVIRLGLYLALLSQLPLATGCREAGGIGGGSSATGNASSIAGGATLGAVIYTVVKHQVQDDPVSPQQKLQVLEQRRGEFVGAIDAMVPADVAGGLRSTLDQVLGLIRDGTLPDLTENGAKLLELLAHDPEDPGDTRLHALLDLQSARSSLDAASLMKLGSRLFAYPEIDALFDAIHVVVSENDGLDDLGNAVASERDLVTELLVVGSRLLRDLERPTGTTSAGVSPLVDTLLQPIDLRGTQPGGPAWAVRVDKHGNPAVRSVSGRLLSPFVDRDGDRAADVNADGEPIDASGQPIDIPAFGDSGARDSYDRALNAQGQLLYDYFDAKKTPLGQAARMLGELIKADVPFELVKAFDRMAQRVPRYDAQTGESYTGYSDQNPLIDAAWAGLEVFRYRDAPKLLDAYAHLIEQTPDTAERVMVKLVEAVDILRHTPSNPSSGAAAPDLLDTLIPLLDRAFEVNSQTGKSAARLMLQTFSQEQARLRNLPMGFARMMRYSDWANRIPTQPGQKSMFERLLDMMAEANRCDSWPFGNMAEFYLKAMIGEQKILFFNISVNTINQLLDVSILRQLLCNQISESNVRALHAFAQSGALDSIIPIVKAFYQAGELKTIKEIFLSLQSGYAASMRPHEPAIIRLLESGAVELLFETFDEMNTVTVPGTGEPVMDSVADFLEAMVDDDRAVYDRHGQRKKTLLHLLADPMGEVLDRAGSDPGLSDAMDDAFNIILATTNTPSGTVLLNHGLVPLFAAALREASDAMSSLPWVRSQDIDQMQADILTLMTGREIPLLVDVVLAIESSSGSQAVKDSISNVLTPNLAATHDIYASILEVGAAVLQTKADPTAMVDLLRFAGRALDPRKGISKPLVTEAMKLVHGPGGSTLLRVVRNALDKGPNGTLDSPVEVVFDVLDEVAAVGTTASASAPDTVDTIRQDVMDVVEFIRDTDGGVARIWIDVRGY